MASDVNFTIGGGSQVVATTFTDPDIDLAGTTAVAYVGCNFSGAKPGINRTYTEYFTPYGTIDEKRCIYSHEIGHALGLAHSNFISNFDYWGEAHSSDVSIMRGGERYSRCHVVGPPLMAKIDDVSDVNFKY